MSRSRPASAAPRLQADLTGAIHGADAGLGHVDEPATHRDLGRLDAVMHRRAVGVVAALDAGDLGDLGVEEFGEDFETDRDRGGQQPVAHPFSEQLELSLDPSGQRLGQTRASQIDQPQTRDDLQIRAHVTSAGGARVRLAHRGGPPLRTLQVMTTSACRKAPPRRRTTHQVPRRSGQPPGRSALDAVGQCRKRCWKYDWVVDLDIRAFFDSIDHDLLLKAVSTDTDLPWVLLYVERWLQAPLQRDDGTNMTGPSFRSERASYRRGFSASR